MPLDRFAEAVMQTNSAHAEIEQILNEAILQSDQNSKHTTVLCAQTLGRVTTAPQTLFRRLHDSYLNRYPYFRRHLSVRDLMMILRERNQHSDEILQFAVKQLPHNDFWTRHDAVVFIGEFGAAAKESLPQLRSYLNAERPEMRLAAAVAIYRVSGEIKPMNKLLDEDEFSAVDARYRPRAMSAIEELGSAGEPFLDYVLKGFDETEFPFRSVDVVDVLEAIGTARAQAKLMELAQSWIWEIRVNAKAAVKRLETGKAP
jgi:Tfp pilus assembly protein FimV